MSLFASLGQGDIWALSGISFASAINDILDRDEFSLEELLEEDELIQEVKSKNELLIEFLCLESTIDKLVNYIVELASGADSDLRKFKYPYMSCEVICCEIPEILASLVEQHDGRYLNKLFSILSTDIRLDNYLSGYFEKILEMLFRRMTIPMMKYLNNAGAKLLFKFLNHMDNYSVMQIIQRLMLPHIPFSNQPDLETLPYEEIKEHYQCNWSYINECCVMLLDRLFDPSNVDTPLHVSDLLITVLQLSPPETLVIKRLCDPESVAKLLVHSVAEDADTLTVACPFSSAASMSLASISVLESLISRLFESSLPFEPNSSRELDTEHFEAVKASIDAICDEFMAFVPQIEAILRRYIDNSPCEQLLDQTKGATPRLGHRGLQLVKLIESVVRLGNPVVDKCMCDSRLFQTCIDLFYHFRGNSLLHLSVQRIFITIIESDRSRSATQVFVLMNCNLVNAVMGTVGSYDGKAVGHEITHYHANKHSSVMGNAILMAQALSLALEIDVHGMLAESSTITDAQDLDTGANKEEVAQGGLVQNTSELAICLEASHHESLSFRSLIHDETLLTAWDEFVDSTLRPILEHQIGGNVYPANAMDFSAHPLAQEDGSLKLGVDFNMYHMEDEDDDDEDRDDFFAQEPHLGNFRQQETHHIKHGQEDRSAEEQERDVWGDDYFEDNVSHELTDSGSADPFASTPESANVTSNSLFNERDAVSGSFDFTGFADFDSFNDATQPFDTEGDVQDAGHESAELPATTSSAFFEANFDAFGDEAMNHSST